MNYLSRFEDFYFREYVYLLKDVKNLLRSIFFVLLLIFLVLLFSLLPIDFIKQFLL